jgi:hypothetical protein
MDEQYAYIRSLDEQRARHAPSPEWLLLAREWDVRAWVRMTRESIYITQNADAAYSYACCAAYFARLVLEAQRHQTQDVASHNAA